MINNTAWGFKALGWVATLSVLAPHLRGAESSSCLSIVRIFSPKKSALIGVEDLGHAVANDRFAQRLDAEISAEAVRQAPREHAPRRPLDDRDQIPEARVPSGCR